MFVVGRTFILYWLRQQQALALQLVISLVCAFLMLVLMIGSYVLAQRDLGFGLGYIQQLKMNSALIAQPSIESLLDSVYFNESSNGTDKSAYRPHKSSGALGGYQITPIAVRELVNYFPEKYAGVILVNVYLMIAFLGKRLGTCLVLMLSI